MGSMFHVLCLQQESKVGAAFVKEEAAGKVVDPLATAMEEDDSSASELTGLGMELLRQMAASRCASEDGSVGGPMCCASYASSQASDGRPATPESALPGTPFPPVLCCSHRKSHADS